MNKTAQSQSKLLPTLILVAFAALQGCSGSSAPSDSPVGTELADGANTNFSNENQNADSAGSITTGSLPETVMEQTAVSMDETPLADTDLNIDVNSGNDGNTGTVADTNTDSNIDAPDPMIQNRIDVSFEVTVPAYQSNELQVKLSWGDFNTSLAWIGDELWSTDANLPTDTEALLSIVFYDDNGNLELGSYEKTYRSGTNAAEIYQVSADQFDTSRWDEDGDGTSNLDELIAGTAPDVDEDSLLNIIDERRMGLLFIANYFETIIGNERPNQLAVVEDFEEWVGRAERADIDANGNGTASSSYWHYGERESRSAVRTVSDNRVLWEGSWSFYNGDYGLWQEFNSEVTVNGDTRTLVETGTGSWVGTYSDRWETSVKITGTPIEGSDYCTPESGTIVQTNRSNRDGGTVSTLTVTRESGNDLWRVNSSFESINNTNTSEYFARELTMHQIVLGYQRKVSEHDHFFCNFADL